MSQLEFFWLFFMFHTPNVIKFIRKIKAGETDI